MREAVKTVGFALVLVGTVDLLVAEFAVESGSAASALTKAFAAFSVLGLAALAYSHWGMRSERTGTW